jgi:hypothetical protein
VQWDRWSLAVPYPLIEDVYTGRGYGKVVPCQREPIARGVKTMKKGVSWTFLVTASLLALVVTAQRAEAAEVTFIFGGTITTVQKGFYDTLPAPWNEVHVDDVWTLTYSFDDTVTNASPLPGYGIYQCAILSYKLEVGSVTVAGQPPCGLGWIKVANDAWGLPADSYQIGLGDTPKHVNLHMDLLDDPGSAFDSVALPKLIPTPLATTFTSMRGMTLDFVSPILPSQAWIEGSVDWFAPGSLAPSRRRPVRMWSPRSLTSPCWLERMDKRLALRR